MEYTQSGFEREPRDFYPTPYKAVLPLIPHLEPATNFHEPCAGNGALARHLNKLGMVVGKCGDIEPQSISIEKEDALTIEFCQNGDMVTPADMFITNPPHVWKILDPLITHLSGMAPTWLLLPAPMMHNKRMANHMSRCVKVVSIGRVKWFEGSKETSTKDFAWYQFCNFKVQTIFYGREK